MVILSEIHKNGKRLNLKKKKSILKFGWLIVQEVGMLYSKTDILHHYIF